MLKNPSLNLEHTKNKMEGSLHDEELTKTLNEYMKPNSAPDINGFTVKFMRAFSDSLTPLLREAVNSLNHRVKMTSTFHIAILTLLLKSVKYPTNLGSYGPISLLSVLYMIASWALSNRLKNALPYIIVSQQKAYVPNDNIGSVLLNLLSLIEDCNRKKILRANAFDWLQEGFQQYQPIICWKNT